MVDSILLDEKRVLPLHRVPRGRVRGSTALYMGVPVKLGSAGIEQIYEVDLDGRRGRPALKALGGRRARRSVSVLSS